MSKIRLHGSSSGHTEVAPAAAAGNNTVTLPNSAGTLLLTDGSAASLTQIPAANIVGVATAGLASSSGILDNTPGWLAKLSSNYTHSSTNTWQIAPLATETMILMVLLIQLLVNLQCLLEKLVNIFYIIINK